MFVWLVETEDKWCIIQALTIVAAMEKLPDDWCEKDVISACEFEVIE